MTINVLSKTIDTIDRVQLLVSRSDGNLTDKHWSDRARGVSHHVLEIVTGKNQKVTVQSNGRE